MAIRELRVVCVAVLLTAGGCPENDAPAVVLSASPDQTTYESGTTVTLSARVYNEDASRLRWEVDGVEIGRGAGPFDIVLTRTVNVWVGIGERIDEYAYDERTLEVIPGEMATLIVRIADGGGSVALPGPLGLCTDVCTTSVPFGLDLQITAYPDASHQFAFWSGCSESTDTNLILNVDAPVIDCTATFVPGEPACDAPLTVTLSVPSPALQCATTFEYMGTTYPEIEVAQQQVMVQAAPSHSTSLIRWDLAVQDPTAPVYQDSLNLTHTLQLFPSSEHGVAVEVTDTCQPPRTASTVLVLYWDDAVCP